MKLSQALSLLLSSSLSSSSSSSSTPIYDEKKHKFQLEPNKIGNKKKSHVANLDKNKGAKINNNNDNEYDGSHGGKLFVGCNPSTIVTTAITTTTSVGSSSEQEVIDRGHLLHHGDDPAGGCASPGEVCVAKTNTSIAKIVDALTQQEDASYDEGLCIYISYFADKGQEEAVIDYSGTDNYNNNINTIASNHYYNFANAVNNNLYRGGNQNSGDGKEVHQQQHLRDDETDINYDNAVTQVDYYDAGIFGYDEEYDHNHNRDIQSHHYQIDFDNYRVSAEHRQLSTLEEYCSEECPNRPKVVKQGSSFASLVDACFDGGCPVKYDYKNIPIGCWNVSSVRSMSNAFRDQFFNKPLKCWDVSEVTLMSELFSGAFFFNQPINGWNVGKVTDMARMFQRAKVFNKPLDGWTVGEVTAMDDMFYYALSFNQLLDSWNVGKITKMRRMFGWAVSFNQPINNWDVGKTFSMNGTFKSARIFNQQLDNWDVGKVKNMSSMFRLAFAFNQPINNWDVGQVMNMDSMFYKAYQFNQQLDDWDVGKVMNMDKMFYKAFRFNQQLDDWDVGQVMNMSNMFSQALSFNQQLDDWDVGQVMNMDNMFYKAFTFNQCLSSWAQKTSSGVQTTSMLSNTQCPNTIVNSTIGPWCQTSKQGCFEPAPSSFPSFQPSLSDSPSSLPSSSQIPSNVPSIDPSDSPSFLPSSSQIPSDVPTIDPSQSPSTLPSSSQQPSDSGAPSTSPTVDCSDEEDFRFVIQKKSGIIKDFGGCSSFVAKKPKKRCKKKIHGKLVAFSCPVTCRKCTCEDQKTVTFKFGRKKKRSRECVKILIAASFAVFQRHNLLVPLVAELNFATNSYEQICLIKAVLRKISNIYQVNNRLLYILFSNIYQ